MPSERRTFLGWIPGGWLGRLVVVLALTTGALELVWVVGANVALRGTAVRAAANEKPEELWMDWHAATTWWPGRIRLEGFTIRGQDDQDQWYGEADHADLVVRLRPVFEKRIVADRIQLRGVTFRLRPRLDFVPAGSVTASHLPPIPGYTNPPEKAPAPVVDSGPSEGRHWALELADIQVDELRELWINEGRLNGNGSLRGRLDYVLSGPFRAEVFELRLPGSSLSLRSESLSTNLTLGLSGVLGPLKFSETHRAEYFQRITAALELQGGLTAGPLLSRHLGTTDSLEIVGRGQVEAAVRVEAGRLRAPSHLDLKSPGLAVRVGHVVIGGDSRITVGVREEGTNTVSAMTVGLRRLQLRHRDEATVAAESGDLELRATAYDAVLPDGFHDVSVALRVGPLELPDAQVLNGFLPGKSLGSFRQGEFRLEAVYDRARDGAGRGRLSLDGRQLGFLLGDHEYSGVIGVAADFRLGTNRVLELEPASVAVTNATMTGVRNRQADGWHARVDIDRGSVRLGDETDIGATLRLALLDTRPLLAMLREDEESPRWVRFMPTLKDLSGGTRLKIEPDRTVLRDFRLRGAATEVLAQLTLREGKPDGIVYARYGIVSAGLDFRNGGSDWTIFGAKRKYRRALAEMQLETADAPEGEDEPEARSEK